MTLCTDRPSVPSVQTITQSVECLRECSVPQSKVLLSRRCLQDVGDECAEVGNGFPFWTRQSQISSFSDGCKRPWSVDILNL